MILAAKNAFCLKIQNIAGGILPMKMGQDYNWIGRYKPFSK